MAASMKLDLSSERHNTTFSKTLTGSNDRSQFYNQLLESLREMALHSNDKLTDYINCSSASNNKQQQQKQQSSQHSSSQQHQVVVASDDDDDEDEDFNDDEEEDDDVEEKKGSG